MRKRREEGETEGRERGEDRDGGVWKGGGGEAEKWKTEKEE